MLRVVQLRYRCKEDPCFSLCLGPLPSLTLALTEDGAAEIDIRQRGLGLPYHTGCWLEKYICSKTTEIDFKIFHYTHKWSDIVSWIVRGILIFLRQTFSFIPQDSSLSLACLPFSRLPSSLNAVVKWSKKYSKPQNRLLYITHEVKGWSATETGFYRTKMGPSKTDTTVEAAPSLNAIATYYGTSGNKPW